MLTVFYQLVYVKGFADNIESIFIQIDVERTGS